MNIWTYWEGPKPDYIDVCLKSVERLSTEFNHNFNLVTADTADGLVKDWLHPNYKKIPQIGPRTNAIRAALLARYGGWWWDADTIALKDPATLLNGAPVLYAVWDKQPLRILNGYIYMQKGCTQAKTWLDKINYDLEHDLERCKLCLELGEKVLTPLLEHDRESKKLSRDTFLPIDIDSSVKVFFEQGNPNDFVQPHSVCYGLNHSWFMFHKKDEITKPLSQWPNSPLLIHRLLSGAITC